MWDGTLGVDAVEELSDQRHVLRVRRPDERVVPVGES